MSIFYTFVAVEHKKNRKKIWINFQFWTCVIILWWIYCCYVLYVYKLKFH